jgi:AcrR family transcriptional regulator
MQDIVREAELSPGAIYRYFAAKEDIVAAIARGRHAREKAMLDEAARRESAGAGLHHLAEAFLGQLTSAQEQEWRRVTIQLWGEALRNPRVMEITREGLDAPLLGLTKLIRRAQREGRLARGVKPEAMARVAAAIFQGLVLQQAWDPRLDVAACVRAAIALLEGLGATGRTRSRSARNKG